MCSKRGLNNKYRKYTKFKLSVARIVYKGAQQFYRRMQYG